MREFFRHRAVLFALLAMDSVVIWSYSASWLDVAVSVLFGLCAAFELLRGAD